MRVRGEANLHLAPQLRDLPPFRGLHEVAAGANFKCLQPLNDRLTIRGGPLSVARRCGSPAEQPCGAYLFESIADLGVSSRSRGPPTGPGGNHPRSGASSEPWPHSEGPDTARQADRTRPDERRGLAADPANSLLVGATQRPGGRPDPSCCTPTPSRRARAPPEGGRRVQRPKAIPSDRQRRIRA